MNQANKDIIQRLLKYRDVVFKLKAMGLVKVFSDNLADAVGVSPSLVRKDFSAFGLTGHKRGGYRIDDLGEELGRILGADEVQKVVVVGCGKIGSALLSYRGFSRQRIRIVAGFDVNPAKMDSEASIPVLDVAIMPEVIRREGVRIAVAAVPETAASEVAESLLSAGVRGILNFAPVILKSTGTCIVHNINVALELENLFYFVRFSDSQLKDPTP